MSEEMNLYKRCKNIFKAHGVDMGGGGSGGSAPVLEFTYEERGESAGEVIVSTELTWPDIANAVRSNPNTVAHIIMNSGEYISLPVLMLRESENSGSVTFGISGVLPMGETEEGNPLWGPFGGMLFVDYSVEDDEMSFQCIINMML